MNANTYVNASGWRRLCGESAVGCGSGGLGRQVRGSRGFTLLEVMVTTVLLTLTLGLALGGFLYALKNFEQTDVEQQLTLDTRKAIERLRADLRLSAIDKMVYYPATGATYQAISFPMADDSDGDGILELNSSQKLIWDRTVIYHIFPGSPDELRVTTFYKRNNTASGDAGRQGQLNRVVQDGNGANASMSGETTSTFVIFRNLFRWEIKPKPAIFDGYAAVPTRVENVDLGSFVMSGGVRSVKFTATGKNTNSTGYRFVVDSLAMSPCRSMREAEWQSAITASNATPVPTESFDQFWSERNYLGFAPGATNAWLAFGMENDRWEETLFASDSDEKDGVQVRYQMETEPHNYVLELEGNKTNWWAYRQTGDANAAGSTSVTIPAGAVIRILVKGRDLEGPAIDASGAQSRLIFRSGSGPFHIAKAWIARCSTTAAPDAEPGTEQQLKFKDTSGSASDHVTINPGDEKSTILTDYAIDKSKSYLVSFLVGNTSSNVPVWVNPSGTEVSCYYMTSPDSATAASDPVWSSSTNVVTQTGIPGLSHMYCTYVPTGIFVSAVCDTRLSAPVYNAFIVSNAVALPGGAAQTVEFRTAAAADMTNSSGWIAPSGWSLASLDKKKYMQYRVTLTPSSDTLVTPQVAMVVVRWGGAAQLATLSGTFGKGPDYGIYEVSVDGIKLKSAIQIDLELFRGARGFKSKGEQTLTAFASLEINPRNTGK